MANYAHTKSRIWQWTGIILILCLFGGAYWYFQVRASTLNQSQNDLNTNGLVGLWSFNGDDISGTTAYDRSGAGNNGTLTNGPTVTDGRVGQALRFDGVNDYVANGFLFNNRSQLSVSYWIKLDNLPAVDFMPVAESHLQGVFRTRINPSGAFEFVVRTTNNAWYSAGTSATTASGKLSAGRWYHVVGTYDGQYVRVYIDGSQGGIGSQAISGNIYDSGGGSNFYIGHQDFGNYTKGAIDEVRVYNRAITASEVASLYTQGGGTKVNTAVSQPQGTGRLDSGLAGYWKMDDGSGTSATDASTNGNTAYFINTPTWTTGQIGGALDFTDPLENQSLSVADVFDMPDGANFSIAGWFYRSTFNTVDIIIAKTAGLGAGYTGYGIYIDDTSDALVLLGADGTDMYTLTSSSTFTGTGWNHFVAVWNDTSANETKLYINGKLENSTASGTFANVGGMSNVNLFHIGSESDIYTSNQRSFRGRLDEIRVYNRTLSADEVAQLYRLNTPTSVDTSLKGYWSFNASDMASTTAYDRSGAGNTGTLTNGPTITEGKLGQALSFDGSNDYITVKTSSLISASSALTVSAWVKTSLTADNQNIYTENNATNGYLVHQVSILNTGKVVYDTYTPSGGGLNSATSVNDGVWHHITVTRAVDDTTSIYIDGILDIFGSVADYDAGFSVDNVSIGRRHNTVTPSQDDYFSGLMDEVRIYNRALSAGEVKGLYDVGQSDKVNSSASQPQGTGRLDSGLAGYWKLDENTGTSAADSSTNANTGTLINMENGDWTTGQIGNGLTFDGTNEYINVPGSTLLTPPQTTLATWVKIGSAPTNYGNIAERGGNGGYRFRINNDQTVSFIMVGVSLTTSATVALDTWTHIAVVGSASGRKIYLNGVLSASSATAYNSGTTSGYDFHIGGNTPDAEYFNGSIDEFRIYNRVLSADEVAQLYRLTTPTGSDTSLKGYWSFNGQDLSGTTAYDRSGAGNTGTLTNGPAITEGKLGQALSFDGTDDYVSVSDSASLSPSAAMTVSFWSKITGTFASERPLIGKDASGQRSWRILSTTSAGIKLCVAADANDSCGQFGTSNNNVLTQNKWSYISVVFDGAGSGNAGRAKVYVDGVLISMTYTGTIPASLVDVAAALTFGAYSTDRLPGVFDEVRIYNRALSATEIASLYNASR